MESRMLKELLRRYEQIYAPLHEWNLKQWDGDGTEAAVSTAMGLSIAALAAVIFCAGAVRYLLSIESTPTVKFVRAALILLVPFAHYVMFVRNRRYERIHERYKQLSRAEQRRKFRLALVYVGVSVLVIPLLAILAITLWG